MNKNQAVFVAMSSELVGLIVGALYLGKYIEDKYDLDGLAVAGLCMLALFIWVCHLMYMMKKYQNEEADGNEE